MINCEWGSKGISEYSEISDVTIIIDVLSFSTCVDTALNNGAIIYPYPYKENAAEYAESKNAVLAASKRSYSEISLSPLSFRNAVNGKSYVLPSPNGSSLSVECMSKITLTACLRNYRTVAEYAGGLSNNIAVVPAGEKWNDGSIRFAIEDYFCAGAVISVLNGNMSSEALAALNFYTGTKDDFRSIIGNCISANELLTRGFEEDVLFSLELNSSKTIPKLINGCYINVR